MYNVAHAGRELDNCSNLVTALRNSFHCAVPAIACKGNVLLEDFVGFVSGSCSCSDSWNMEVLINVLTLDCNSETYTGRPAFPTMFRSRQ